MRISTKVCLIALVAYAAAAGDDMILLGCNAVNHLCAGIFDASRVGSDTSGKSWEQTVRQALTEAFHRAAKPQSTAEPVGWLESATPEVWKTASGTVIYRW